MSPPRIKYLVALKVFEPEPPLQNKINGFFFANKLTVLSISLQNFPFFWVCQICVSGSFAILTTYENLPRGVRGGSRCVTIR